MATTVQVNDNATPTPNPLPGVMVQVWASDGVTLMGVGVTNVEGQMTFVTPSTLPMSLEIEARQELVQFPVDTVVDVVTDGLTFTITGVPNLATAPGPLARCTVFGYVFKPDGRGDPLTVILDSIGLDVRSQLPGGGTSQTGNPNTAMIRAMKQELRADAQTGYFGVDLVQGLKCRLYIPDMGFERFFTVPALTTCSVWDLVPDARQFYLGVLSNTPSVESIRS